MLSIENLATWLGLDVTFPREDDGQGPSSSILSTDVGKKKNFVFAREDDDQGPASSMLSTDIGKRTSLSLGKTTARA